MPRLIKSNVDQILADFENGNLSYARDEFWNSTKLQMRETMLKANEDFIQDELDRFIRVIFLP